MADNIGFDHEVMAAPQQSDTDDSNRHMDETAVNPEFDNPDLKPDNVEQNLIQDGSDKEEDKISIQIPMEESDANKPVSDENTTNDVDGSKISIHMPEEETPVNEEDTDKKKRESDVETGGLTPEQQETQRCFDNVFRTVISVTTGLLVFGSMFWDLFVGPLK